jgi:hypothetical protein
VRREGRTKFTQKLRSNSFTILSFLTLFFKNPKSIKTTFKLQFLHQISFQTLPVAYTSAKSQSKPFKNTITEPQKSLKPWVIDREIQSTI